MYLVFSVLTLFIVFAALVPLIRSDAWWVRSFDFPRGQIVILGFLVLIAMPLILPPFSSMDRVLMSVLCASLLYLVYHIYPYTPLAPKQVHTAASAPHDHVLSIISSNVLQFNENTGKLIELVKKKKPELLLAVETDDRWEEALRVLEDAYPYQIKHPLDNTYGMLLYSQLPLKNTEIKFLLEEDIPSIFCKVTLPSHKEVEIICLHPKPPRPDKMQNSTERDAELLIVAKYVQHRDEPTVVMGDFNDVAWSHTTRLFQRISGMLDPRRGRGFFNTFHADYPFLRYPLDHIFHTNHFAIEAIERCEHIGSDHFPVYASLVLDERHAQIQPASEPEGNDEEEARRMISNGFRRKPDSETG